MYTPSKNTKTLTRFLSLLTCAFLLCAFNPLVMAQDGGQVQSRVQTEPNGDMFLIQEVTLNAPVKKVWAAFTTTEGWQSWVAPVSEVDFKLGGTIRTNYRKDGKVTDDDSIVNHIINYVPERALTLQAELGPHFPKVLKEREALMYNLITFESLGEDRTKLVSYGIGYQDTPELKKMIDFFIKANEDTYKSLIEYLDD